MSALHVMTAAAEQAWLETWTAGPTEPKGSGLPAGAKAPDIRLTDHEHGLPCPFLCDPHLMAYRDYGAGQWPVERILYDAPAQFWTHRRDIGQAFPDRRRESGRPLVDDPWRASGFPEPRLLAAAAWLS